MRMNELQQQKILQGFKAYQSYSKDFAHMSKDYHSTEIPTLTLLFPTENLERAHIYIHGQANKLWCTH